MPTHVASSAVGLDLGVAKLAALSTGDTFAFARSFPGTPVSRSSQRTVQSEEAEGPGREAEDRSYPRQLPAQDERRHQQDPRHGRA